MRKRSKIGLAAVALACLGGCEALYFLGGKGQAEALCTLPEKSRVLVMVDPRAASGMPVDAPPALGTMINEHLFQFKVADNLVNQARLTELRKNPRFVDMGIADVARAVDADVVVFVDILTFNVQANSGGQLTEGYTQALIKVVDRNGKRLFPAETDSLGYPIESRVPLDLAENQNLAAVRGKLFADLALRTGQIFHKYDLDGKDMKQ